MRRLLPLVFLTAGCITWSWPTSTTPITGLSFPAFVSDVRSVRGYGADTFWLWTDPAVFGDTLVTYGVNATHLEVYNCSPSKAASLTSDPSPHGCWTSARFAGELAGPLDAFLSAMQARKIVTVLSLYGGHNMAGVTDADLTGMLHWLNIRASGTDGIWLNLATEPGDWSPQFSHLQDIVNANWTGVKVWNYGTRPPNAPPGFVIEWHAQYGNDVGPGGDLVVTDSALWYALNLDGSLQSKLDPAKVQEFERRVVAAGNGFVSYGQNEAGWQIDTDGIKAVGGVK